jgi:GMP synthase-like glutamine amidotransferase
MLDATSISTKTIETKPKSLELPFPYNKRPFCRYEPIEKKIEHAKVLIVNDLLRYESDLSEVAKQELNGTMETLLRFERKVSGMACDNIAQNVLRLVKHPKTLTVHLSEVAEAAFNFEPDAIVMSGTYSDFDYYKPEHLAKFAEFTKQTTIPILGICGAHQLIGQTFGAKLRTLDDHIPSEKRKDRKLEFQYRFVKITDNSDPIFAGITNAESEEARVWQDYTLQDDILRVWQNHGLQVKGVPEGFHLLATSYLCKNQMMVKRSEGQLIYSVQFHLEKSFEDWSKNPTRWEHLNESRDGRILFENFLKLALQHRKKADQ